VDRAEQLVFLAKGHGQQGPHAPAIRNFPRDWLLTIILGIPAIGDVHKPIAPDNAPKSD
jgi:hypothetical protein